jgi:serine/threonine protein phosphatase 1
MNRPPLSKKYPLNEKGLDFIIGDVHGCFHLVLDALKATQFNANWDRLFTVGDLIDRGPTSAQALNFLKLPFVHPILGNHEHMLLSIYEHSDNPDPAITNFTFSRNGMSWLKELSNDERLKFVKAFRQLPIAIEIETIRGTVGLVHADVPQKMTWPEFTRALLSPSITEEDRDNLIEETVWSRERINDRDPQGIAGIGRIFVGHTPVQNSTRLGNVYFIDTGAVFGKMAQNPDRGYLTMANVMTKTGSLTPAGRITSGVVNVLDIMPDPMRPFWMYVS